MHLASLRAFAVGQMLVWPAACYDASMWLFFSIPVLFILLGVLVWTFAAHPTVKELGRLTAQAGLIGLCLTLGQHYFPHR